MYKCYKIAKLPISIYYDKYINEGKELQEEFKQTVHGKLNNYLLGKSTLDADEMMKEWFPTVDADIFLSHSHNDINKVLAFSGWLFNEFGLKSFIDSLVWGYADDLLKQVDKQYCLRPERTDLFSYEKRNVTTSNVHMMLMTSLAKMIDKTECLMFLETPESVQMKNSFQKTYSPWIYEELIMSKIIRKKKIKRPKVMIPLNEGKYFDKFKPKFEFPANTNNFIELEYEGLKRWKYFYEIWKKSHEKDKSQSKPQYAALDILYYLYNKPCG